jgi:hypothetical protein
MPAHLPRRLLWLLAALALTAVAGCKETTDLDAPCRLMEPADDQGNLKPIMANDSRINPAFDFLSSGNSDCENLVCIRLHGDPSKYDDSDGTAHGKCSGTCIDKGDCGEPEKGLDCRALSLDQKFLDDLKKNDPTTYQQYFGDIAGSLYCVNPNDLPAPMASGM